MSCYALLVCDASLDVYDFKAFLLKYQVKMIFKKKQQRFFDQVQVKLCNTFTAAK